MRRKNGAISRKYPLPKIGEKYNMLTVISEPFRQGQPARDYVMCQCDCGKVKERLATEVVVGRIRSCGCLKKKNDHSRKHGLEGTRIYRVWRGMIQRCYNPESVNYERYGALGIDMCKEWKEDIHSFVKFAKENGYDENKVIDRIDGNKGYYPENVRFVTYLENNNNRKCVLRLEAFGETKTIRDWSRDHRCRVSYKTLKSRIDQGWDIKKSLLTKKLKSFAEVDEIKAKQIKKDLRAGKRGVDIAKEHGVSVQCISGIKKGRAWARV